MRPISRLADEQDGVVTAEQLCALGYSRTEIRGMLTRELLHRVHRGVYAVGHRRLSVTGTLRAAAFAAGPASFFSHESGASLRQLQPLNAERLELTLPVGHTPRSRATGLVLHRTRRPVDVQDVTVHDGFRTSTVPRLLVELAARRAPEEIAALLAAAVRLDRFDPYALEAALTRHHGRPGVGTLAVVADYYRPLGSRRSEFERIVDAELARRPEVPPCERNVRVGGWEIDCLWRAQRLAVELDGRRYHAAQADFERDRYKDTQLQLLGLRPMRIGYWMWVADTDRQITGLQAMLAMAAGSVPRAA